MSLLRLLVDPADDVPVLLQVLEIVRDPIGCWRELQALRGRRHVPCLEQHVLDAWLRGEQLPNERRMT